MDKMEKIVIGNLEDQSKIIRNTFKEMAVYITEYFKSSTERDQSIEKIKNYEKKTADIRKENLKIVAQTVSIHRSDFLRLVMKMSDVSAHQAGACIRLGNIQFHPEAKDPMIPMFKELIEQFLKMGDELRNLMRYFGDNMDQTLKQCNVIDEIEDNVDQIYRMLHGHLYNREDIDLRFIMQLLSVAKHIEEACDHAASVADSIRIIIAAH